MTEQTKAQRLADWIDNADCNFYGESSIWFDSKLAEKVDEAVAELRRLDALVGELVEVLSEIMSWEENEEMVWAEKANAALAKAKEQT